MASKRIADPDYKGVYGNTGVWAIKGMAKKRRVKDKNRYDGILVCPICGERNSDNVIIRRQDYYECRTCGFINDEMYWEIRTTKHQLVKEFE